jgi:hypothetical protein
MKATITAVALAAAFAQPAAAITFPSLTTIYVGPGVSNLEGDPTVTATGFSCSNVSGQTASLRFLILSRSGSLVGSFTHSLAHGANVTVSTQNINFLADHAMDTGSLAEGTVNIESTQFGVFCTAMIVDPEALIPSGIALHLVRVNPHPGTVE